MLRAAGDPQAEQWLAGAIGEQRVADTLTALPMSWTAVHDRLLMPGISESNLDHVLVGPPGVVLVDAKNYAGDITVWNDSLFQHLGVGERRSSRNLLREVKKVHWMAVQVSRRLGTPVTPVLCLAGNRCDRFGQPQLVCGVWVVHLAALSPGWVDSQFVRRATTCGSSFPACSASSHRRPPIRSSWPPSDATWPRWRRCGRLSNSHDAPLTPSSNRRRSSHRHDTAPDLAWSVVCSGQLW